MHAPLKVTFHLDTPLVEAAYPMHLDALIAYAKTQSELSMIEPGEAPEGARIRSLAENLPLAKIERDGEWVWQASMLLPEGFGEKATRMWTRKTDESDYAARIFGGKLQVSTRTRNALGLVSDASGQRPPAKPYAGKIDTARGLMKNLFEFYTVQCVERLVGWCVGDIDEIEALLAPEAGHITHVGKRSRVGHGRVKALTIEEDPAAAEQWKRRILPWRESSNYEPIQAAFQPPYWAIENRKLAYCPVMA